MSVKENLLHIQQDIPAHVRLVAVSKFHPAEAITEAYAVGQRVFGESKVQELCSKYDSLPKDIEWHFIGHLQTNKVKYIAPFVSLIHAVDSERLLAEINKAAQKANRTIPCLLQIHIASEDSKFGFSADECLGFISSGRWQTYSHVQITGLMGMATYTSNTDKIRSEFRQLKSLFNELKMKYFGENDYFCELSMGMSDDYRIAIEEGSTLVRIGSTIFGNRNY